MNILISGATGFLGSYLTKSFINDGHKVIALIRKGSNKYRLAGYLDRCSFFYHDEHDFDSLFKDNNIDIVINTVVNYGRKSVALNPIIRANLTFGLMLLESSIKFNVKAFINSDSMLDRKIDAYSLSKAQFLDWMRLLPSGSTKVINIKIEHIFGTMDDDSKFIYWLIGKLKSNVKEIKLTSGIQKRDFIYIDDIVNAYKCIVNNIEGLSQYEEYELGSENPQPIKNIINKIYSKVKERQELNTKLNFGAIPYRANENMNMKANTSKIKSLGWKVKTDFDNEIDKIIDEIFGLN